MRFFDSSSRTKLRVTGADRVRFLNGQTTNDVRKAVPGTTQESCVLNAKGHLEARLFLFATEDALWIDADGELREQLRARLERYIVADDVSIQDVSSDWALFHVLSESQPETAAKFCIRSCRLSEPGCDVWIPADEREKTKAALKDAGKFLDTRTVEILRVERGIPRWGRELTPEIIPVEAGIETRAIDYNKGCYVGQEVISRMKMSGQLRQQLCGVVASAIAALNEAMILRAEDKIAGQITSAVFSERLNGYIALAMIRRGYTEPGTELIASDGARTEQVKVVELPFVRE